MGRRGKEKSQTVIPIPFFTIDFLIHNSNVPYLKQEYSHESGENAHMEGQPKRGRFKHHRDTGGSIFNQGVGMLESASVMMEGSHSSMTLFMINTAGCIGAA